MKFSSIPCYPYVNRHYFEIKIKILNLPIQILIDKMMFFLIVQFLDDNIRFVISYLKSP